MASTMSGKIASDWRPKYDLTKIKPFLCLHETTKQVVKLLGIPEGKYSQTFQSRLAGDKWLTPYTDVEVNKMPEKGIKNEFQRPSKGFKNAKALKMPWRGFKSALKML